MKLKETENELKEKKKIYKIYKIISINIQYLFLYVKSKKSK